MNPTHQLKFPVGIKISSVFMILFGLAEVGTSFRHEFFGLTTSQATISTIIGATIGTFYFASGLLVLTKKKLAIFAIITGTSIVIFFAIYIGLKLKYFNGQ